MPAMMRGAVRRDNTDWNAAYLRGPHWNLQHNMGRQKNNSPTLWSGTGGFRDQIDKPLQTFPFQRMMELTSLNSCLAHHPFPIWSLLLMLRVRGSAVWEDCDPNRGLIKFLIIQLTQQLVISGNEAWRGCFIKKRNVKLYKQCQLKCALVGVCMMLIRTGTKYTSY